MEITPDSARDSLDDIRQTVARVQRAVAARGTDWILIVWGVVWIACYVATHLLVITERYDWINLVWMVGSALGLAGMAVVSIAFHRRPRIRSERGRQIGRRVFWSWAALFLFGNVWLTMLWPWHPLQMNAFAVTLVMFGYVMIGLWMESRFFIVLGAAVALAAMAGYLLTAFAGFAYYNLWMALAGGGALLGSGLYIRYVWGHAGAHEEERHA